MVSMECSLLLNTACMSWVGRGLFVPEIELCLDHSHVNRHDASGAVGAYVGCGPLTVPSLLLMRNHGMAAYVGGAECVS